MLKDTKSQRALGRQENCPQVRPRRDRKLLEQHHCVRMRRHPIEKEGSSCTHAHQVLLGQKGPIDARQIQYHDLIPALPASPKLHASLDMPPIDGEVSPSDKRQPGACTSPRVTWLQRDTAWREDFLHCDPCRSGVRALLDRQLSSVCK